MTVAEKILRAKDDYDAVYEAGKKAEHDSFWDVFQNKGARRTYTRGFVGYGFSFANFYPKYDIVVEGDGSQAFYAWTKASNSQLTKGSLKERLEECGVKLDTSKATSVSGLFNYNEAITEVPTIDVTGTTATSTGVFSNSYGTLITIEKIITKESVTYDFWFKEGTGIKNVTFEGVIGQNLDLHWSPLSRASIESTIGCLSDSTTGKTVTLSKTAVENAFADGVIQIAPFNASPSSICTNRGDGSILVHGTPTEDTSYVIKNNLVLQKGDYSLLLEANHHDFTYNDIILSVKKNGEVIASAKYNTQDIPMVFEITEDDALVDLELTVFNTLSSDGSVTVTPSLSYAQDWESLIATKPNWTINLV